jgi:hypothetical protein
MTMPESCDGYRVRVSSGGSRTTNPIESTSASSTSSVLRGNPDVSAGRAGIMTRVAADLLWDDVRELFDSDRMGPLPDACVPHTSAADWQALLDLVVARGWRFEYSEGQTLHGSIC